MVTKDEALKMAIEGLLELHSFVNEELETAYRCNTNQAVKLNAKLDEVQKSIQACKEALEQLAQEPVAIVYSMQDGYIGQMVVKYIPHKTKLYTHPAPSWQGNKEFVGLTDDEIIVISNTCDLNHVLGLIDFGRAIEQELKTKNGFSVLKEKYK